MERTRRPIAIASPGTVDYNSFQRMVLNNDWNVSTWYVGQGRIEKRSKRQIK
jgi:hypothetical protein